MNNRNENKPDYKETKVGWIPTNWDCVRFRKVVLVSQYGLNTPSTEDGTIPIIGMSQLIDGKIIADTGNGKVDITPEEYDGHKIKRGDMLFNRTNSLALVGKTSIADKNLDAVFASYIIRFKIDEEQANPFFVGYFFNGHFADYQLKSLATKGVSQCNINPSVLRIFFYLPLPSLREQHKIVEIIGKCDKAFELVIEQIESKQQLKKGLMQQLLTGKKRFPGFNENWREVKLGKLFSDRRENNPSLELLSITGNEGVIPRDYLGRKDTSNADKSKYKVIKPGDIGYNTMRMWQGRSAVSKLHGIVSPAYTIVTPKKNQDVDFYGYLFKLPKIINLFYRYSQGLVSDTLSLKFPHFSQIEIGIPEFEEQKQIAEVFLNIDQEIEILNKKVESLRKQKQGLMQKLLTGEVRVKV